MAALILQDYLTDPEKAREYLEQMRWPNGVACPSRVLKNSAFK